MGFGETMEERHRPSGWLPRVPTGTLFCTWKNATGQVGSFQEYQLGLCSVSVSDGFDTRTAEASLAHSNGTGRLESDVSYCWMGVPCYARGPNKAIL